MQKEIEAKFLNQNHDEIRSKLKKLGAKCQFTTKLVHRTVFDFPDRRLSAQGSWVRLREELDGSVELMLKTVKTNEIGATFEQPITVHSYDAAKQFLLSIGLEVKSEEESKRELWHLGNVEIMLDEWPWVPPYIEIEAPSEGAVKEVASKLELHWPDAVFGSVIPVYTAEYGISEADFKAAELTILFNQSVPKILTDYRY